MNMVKFAALVSWLTQCRAQSDVRFSEHEIETLQDYVNSLIPEASAVSCADIDALLLAMQGANNGKKIEAIKAYRFLTKTGLKESKDAVEKYIPLAANDPRSGKQEYWCDLLEIQRNSDYDNRLRVKVHQANRHFQTNEIVITSNCEIINFDKGYAVTKNSVYRWK